MVKSIFLFLVLVSINCLATKTPTWYDGSLVLADDEVVVGKITVHESHNLVLVQSGQKAVVYPAYKVHSIFIYDSRANINRKYVSLANSLQNFKTYKLYEIVLRGELTLLRKEKPLSGGSAVDFNYYILDNGKILSLKQFRSKIFPSLANQKEFLEFMRKEDLNPNVSADVVRLIQFYNQMTAESHPIEETPTHASLNLD